MTYLFAGDDALSAYYTVQSKNKLIDTLLDEWVDMSLDDAIIEGELEEAAVAAYLVAVMESVRVEKDGGCDPS